MKSFRLCSLTVYTEVNNSMAKHIIPLLDGLIINKEIQGDRWLIECLIEKDWYQFFNELKTKNEPIIVEASITRKENPPASFAAKVKGIIFIQDQLQLLLDGERLVRKDTFSELILKDLIAKGVSGEELISEFKRIKKDRGPKFQLMIENDIKQIKKDYPKA